jgi:hypothetical protein
MKSTNTQVEHA